MYRYKSSQLNTRKPTQKRSRKDTQELRNPYQKSHPWVEREEQSSKFCQIAPTKNQEEQILTPKKGSLDN